MSVDLANLRFDPAGAGVSRRRGWLGSLVVVGLGWLPLAYLLVLSLARDWRFPDLLPAELSLATWRRAFGPGGGLLGSVLVSFAIAALVAVLATGAGLFASRVFAHHRRRGWWVVAAHAPFVLSPVILGTCLLFLFIKLDLVGSVPGVVAAQFLFCYGYAIILLIGFWNPRLAALDDLARTLGASRGQRLRRVFLPLAKPLLVVCWYQTFLISWFDYGLAAVIGAGKVPVLTLRVFEYLGSGDVHLAAAAACLLIAPPLVLLIANRRLASPNVV